MSFAFALLTIQEVAESLFGVSAWKDKNFTDSEKIMFENELKKHDIFENIEVNENFEKGMDILNFVDFFKNLYKRSDITQIKMTIYIFGFTLITLCLTLFMLCGAISIIRSWFKKKGEDDGGGGGDEGDEESDKTVITIWNMVAFILVIIVIIIGGFSGLSYIERKIIDTNVLILNS